jgi:putative glutamine amidotransferase
MLDPVIALPTYNALNDDPDYVLRRAYCQAIEAAGGVPLLVPLLQGERSLRRLYDLSTGLLLCGGGDVAAEHYGVPDGGLLKYVDPERDRVELLLARWALAEGKPILGICRGIQLLNVAAGGTLIQDIPTDVGTAVRHSTHTPERMHPLTIAWPSLLAEALGLDALRPIMTNTSHHQAVSQVAPGFAVVARAEDGVIEAIERPPYALGVQWHPERMVPGDEHMQQLFRHFMRAAACVEDARR